MMKDPLKKSDNNNKPNKELEIIFLEREVNIKISIESDELVKSTANRIENILGINISILPVNNCYSSTYEFFISNFHIGDFFSGMNTLELLEMFSSNSVTIMKKPQIFTPSFKNEFRIVNKSLDELSMNVILFDNLLMKEVELKETFEELNVLEENLSSYNKSISTPFHTTNLSPLKKENLVNLSGGDSSSFNSFLNKNSDFDDTGIIKYLYRGYQCFKEEIL
jgi:hypothetical protein